MLHVAVTGASGFIGGHLLSALSEAGYQVHAILRNARATPLPGIRYFECSDIAHRAEWDQALEGVDVAVHLVARVHMKQRSSSDADEYQRVNVEASVEFARACSEHAVKRLVYISTIKVNGEATSASAFTAGDVPTRTHEAYARTKRDTESALFAIGRQTGLQVAVIRPPLVYGPGVKGNFHSMMRAVKSGWPLPLASVANRRSLVNVFNLCDLIRVCLVHPAAAGEVFLVCDEEDVSTPGLLRALAAAMQCKVWLVPCPVTLLRLAGAAFGQADTISRLCGDLRVDMDKTRELLNWEPPCSFIDGIERTAKALC